MSLSRQKYRALHSKHGCAAVKLYGDPAGSSLYKLNGLADGTTELTYRIVNSCRSESL